MLNAFRCERGMSQSQSMSQRASVGMRISESDLLWHMSDPGERNTRVRGTMAGAAGAVEAAETEDDGGGGHAVVVKCIDGHWRSSRSSVNSIRRRGDKIIGSVPVHNKFRSQGVAAMCVRPVTPQSICPSILVCPGRAVLPRLSNNQKPATAVELTMSSYCHRAQKDALRTRAYVNTVGVCALYLGKFSRVITPGIQLYASPRQPGPPLSAQLGTLGFQFGTASYSDHPMCVRVASSSFPNINETERHPCVFLGHPIGACPTVRKLDTRRRHANQELSRTHRRHRRPCNRCSACRNLCTAS